MSVSPCLIFLKHGFWVRNSDPHGCKTNTLPTEPCAQPISPEVYDETLWRVGDALTQTLELSILDDGVEDKPWLACLFSSNGMS